MVGLRELIGSTGGENDTHTQAMASQTHAHVDRATKVADGGGSIIEPATSCRNSICYRHAPDPGTAEQPMTLEPVGNALTEAHDDAVQPP